MLYKSTYIRERRAQSLWPVVFELDFEPLFNDINGNHPRALPQAILE